MNLIVPPFDDIHVRKAVNFVDRQGGAAAGDGWTDVGRHRDHDRAVRRCCPTPASYDPYPSPNFAGDVDAAKAEMAQSRYDSDGDGVCDDPVCTDVLMINRNYDPFTQYTPILQQNLSEIGIDLKVRELDISTAYTTVQTMNNLVPMAINVSWGKDYASPYGFDYFLFSTAGLSCQGMVNYSNIGLTAESAEECGENVLDAYNAAVDANGEIPSVDADMEACVATEQGDAYNACWAALDQRIMEEIVPWVPYRWGSQNTVQADSVTRWVFDQSTGWTAYSRVAVDNGLTMEEVAQV